MHIRDFKEKRNFVGLQALAVAAIYLMIYAFSPGYIIPFLNNPIARICVLLVIAWQILGSIGFVFIPFNSRRWVKLTQMVLFFILFVLPSIFAVLLGPAINPIVIAGK